MFILAEITSFDWTVLGLAVSALVVAVIALVVAIMALPTVLQMLFGKPNIVIRFTEHDVQGVRIMRCMITNAPVYNHLLRKLGVRRVPAYVEGTFDITEEATGKVVAEDRRMFSAAGQSESTVLIKPSFMPEVVVSWRWTPTARLPSPDRMVPRCLYAEPTS